VDRVETPAKQTADTGLYNTFRGQARSKAITEASTADLSSLVSSLTKKFNNSLSVTSTEAGNLQIVLSQRPTGTDKDIDMIPIGDNVNVVKKPQTRTVEDAGEMKPQYRFLYYNLHTQYCSTIAEAESFIPAGSGILKRTIAPVEDATGKRHYRAQYLEFDYASAWADEEETGKAFEG
jgi:hypothetical protein